MRALMRGVSVCLITQIIERPSGIDPCQKYRREKTAAQNKKGLPVWQAFNIVFDVKTFGCGGRI